MASISNTTMVALSPDEARLFIEFQKRYAFMQLMESVDAFSIKGGSITVHFDDMGSMGKLEVHRVYRPIR